MTHESSRGVSFGVWEGPRPRLRRRHRPIRWISRRFRIFGLPDSLVLAAAGNGHAAATAAAAGNGRADRIPGGTRHRGAHSRGGGYRRRTNQRDYVDVSDRKGFGASRIGNEEECMPLVMEGGSGRVGAQGTCLAQ